MKNVDDYLDNLNNTIDSMQKEANFYLVIQLFDKLKEFQTLLKAENAKTEIGITSKNSLANPGYWMEFDNSNEDMVEMFNKAGIKTAKGINHIEHLFELPMTFTEDMTLDNFVKNCTTENYQKEFLSYKLDTQLSEKKHISKKKI
jgi:hypothetical protein